jgi:hypothetical protein
MAPRAPCKDCGKDTEPIAVDGTPLFHAWDLYMVRDAVWSDAGMSGWESGFLCTFCLQKRLGRSLTDADYLAQPVGADDESLHILMQPEQIERNVGTRPHAPMVMRMLAEDIDALAVHKAPKLRKKRRR